MKITKPDEFDLVFFLKFPENDRIIVKSDPQRPGNVTLNMTDLLNTIQNQEHNKATFISLKKIVNAKNFLLQDKLQDMLNGAFTRALNKMKYQVVVNGTSTKLAYKRCGPAHTICVNEGSMNYSVDFVPSIKLSAKQNILSGDQLEFFKNVEYWDAIPKPLKPFQPNNISFRASYYEAENIMIRNKQKLKNVIKLMKRFRDTKQNMNNLKSYYIKTLLLWQIKERPDTYWVNKQLNEIYIDVSNTSHLSRKYITKICILRCRCTMSYLSAWPLLAEGQNCNSFGIRNWTCLRHLMKTSERKCFAV